MRADREHFELVLRDEPGHDQPAVVRLRAFLKDAMRIYGLRCIRGKCTTKAEAKPHEGSTKQ